MVRINNASDIIQCIEKYQNLPQYIKPDYKANLAMISNKQVPLFITDYVAINHYYDRFYFGDKINSKPLLCKILKISRPTLDKWISQKAITLKFMYPFSLEEIKHELKKHCDR